MYGADFKSPACEISKQSDNFKIFFTWMVNFINICNIYQYNITQLNSISNIFQSSIITYLSYK